MSDRTCTVEGCDRPRRKREWCSTHYGQWRRTNVLPPCSVDGCTHTSASHGICNMHLKRLRAHGTTDDIRPSMEDRFWSKVDKNGPPSRLGQCWIWTAGKDRHGYGLFGRANGSSLAHRIAYELTVGPIPDGLVLDHFECYNPACVNPAHLRPVTIKLNVENRAGLARNNTSGARGVYWHKMAHKYLVQVVSAKKHYYGGLFVDLAEAEAAAIALRNQVMTNNLLDRRAS